MLGVLTPAPVCVTFGVCLHVLHRKYPEENVPKRERERKKKPHIAHKRKPNTSLLCCLGSRRLFIGILWQRVPVRRHFTGPGKMRRISAFALCACLFLQSVFSFFCLNQYQCKRLRRLITATRSAHFALTGDRGRMINALHCGMVRWRVNND